MIKIKIFVSRVCTGCKQGIIFFTIWNILEYISDLLYTDNEITRINNKKNKYAA